jgi:hypothetical protein
MHTNRLTLLLVAFLAFSLAACGSNPPSTSVPTDIPTSVPAVAPTLEPTHIPPPTATATPLPTDTPTLADTPTSVPTATLAPSATETPAPTNTPTAAVTATPTLEPMVTITRSTYLRTGPGAVYVVAGSATSGQTLKVVGRDSSATWLVVLLPGNSTRKGWVSLTMATFNGDVASLPEVAVPPTPVPAPPTLTPAPTPQGGTTNLPMRPLPGTSHATVGQQERALGHFLYIFADEVPDCKDYSQVNTEFLQETQPVTRDETGFPTAGEWSERWTFNLCGTQHSYIVTYTMILGGMTMVKVNELP